MSYIFEYFTRVHKPQPIIILNREEFSELSDEQKLFYQAGPIEEDGDSLTLLIQGFIYTLLIKKDPLLIPQFLDNFIKENYKNKYKEICLAEPDLLDREKLFWDFIEEEGDEAEEGIDLYIVDMVYKNDDLYSMLIEECEKRSIKVINQDINVAAKINYKIEERIEEFKNEKVVSHATFAIIIWVANVLKDSNKNCILHDPEDNLFKRNVLPLLELESMKTLISQIINMAEIMGELDEYLHIGEGHEGNYPSIEKFKKDLDLEYIKKFMREVCDELMIK